MEKVKEVLKEYRKTAKVVLNTQLSLLYKNSKLNKNHKLNINTKLSARYLQTLQYQIVGMLDSYLSNRQNDFKEIVLNSSLDTKIKKELLYINKYKKWFVNEITLKDKAIEQEIIKLSRAIIKHTFKKNRFPNIKRINLQLDSKVAKIETKKENKAVEYDYWIKLSTLEKGNPIYLPIKSNNYFENIEGKIKNFVQIIVDKEEVVFMKEVKKRDYIPKTKKIAIDLGLRNLFATDRGDLIGRNFIDYLTKADEKIVKLYKPKEIVIERLNFQSPKLSKKLNRIIQNFGKSIIRKKLETLKEEFNIKITEVNPAYTSQTCHNCGYVSKSNRKSQKVFVCKFCGKKQNLDINASRNILKRSSYKNGGIYISKSKILDELVNLFIERYKGVNSCPLILTNPYFMERLE